MQPLRGITVVAVEQAVAAPICTRHLGDLGARVIKVENSRAGGDFARDYDDVVLGMSAYFAWANRNKESVALDLEHPLGREAVVRLVRLRKRLTAIPSSTVMPCVEKRPGPDGPVAADMQALCPAWPPWGADSLTCAMAVYRSISA